MGVHCLSVKDAMMADTALGRKIATIEHYAEESECGYEIQTDTFESHTVVSLDNGWNQFKIRLGERGGLKRAEYDTTGWGAGDFVKEEDTKSGAWSWTLKAIEHPEPYED